MLIILALCVVWAWLVSSTHKSVKQEWISVACRSLLVINAIFAAAETVTAQPYCAVYDNGSKNCGIPTIASCQESVSGVGGICEPDLTSQMRPDLFDRRRLEQALQDATPPGQSGFTPGSPNWMPPPPDE
jgi:hypothetical protein